MNIIAFSIVWVCYTGLLVGLLMLVGNNLFEAIVDANTAVVGSIIWYQIANYIEIKEEEDGAS